jgi:hypothetical protein
MIIEKSNLLPERNPIPDKIVEGLPDKKPAPLVFKFFSQDTDITELTALKFFSE